MRADVVAAVSDEGGEIRYLQGRGEHFPLPDGDGDDGVAVPCALVELIVDAAIWDISALLTRQVDTEAVAEAEGDHTLLPVLQSDGCRGVMAAVVEHEVQAPAEVRITRGGECGDE